MRALRSSAADLPAVPRQQGLDVAGVKSEQIAVQRHLEGAHRQAALQPELERPFEQSPDEPGDKSVARADAVHSFDLVAVARDDPIAARGNRPLRSHRDDHGAGTQGRTKLLDNRVTGAAGAEEV